MKQLMKHLEQQAKMEKKLNNKTKRFHLRINFYMLQAILAQQNHHIKLN